MCTKRRIVIFITVFCGTVISVSLPNSSTNQTSPNGNGGNGNNKPALTLPLNVAHHPDNQTQKVPGPNFSNSNPAKLINQIRTPNQGKPNADTSSSSSSEELWPNYDDKIRDHFPLMLEPIVPIPVSRPNRLDPSADILNSPINAGKYPLPIRQSFPFHGSSWTDAEVDDSDEADNLNGDDLTPQDVKDFADYLQRIHENLMRSRQGNNLDHSGSDSSESAEDESPGIYNEKTVEVNIKQTDHSDVYGLPKTMTLDDLRTLLDKVAGLQNQKPKQLDGDWLKQLLTAKAVAKDAGDFQPPPPPPPMGHFWKNEDPLHRGLSFDMHVSTFSLLTMAVILLTGYLAYLICKYKAHKSAHQVYATMPQMAQPMPMKVETVCDPGKY